MQIDQINEARLPNATHTHSHRLRTVVTSIHTHVYLNCMLRYVNAASLTISTNVKIGSQWNGTSIQKLTHVSDLRD